MVTKYVNAVVVNNISSLICQAYDTQLELEYDREQENLEKVLKDHFFKCPL